MLQVGLYADQLMYIVEYFKLIPDKKLTAIFKSMYESGQSSYLMQRVKSLLLQDLHSYDSQTNRTFPAVNVNRLLWTLYT
jgi:hypothetical protein